MGEADDIPWEALYARAEEVLKSVTAGLPEALRAEAEKIPVLLQEWPDDTLEPDTMGYYPHYEAGVLSSAGGPIMLFLGSIFVICEETGLDFMTEVERTFLHELGHHLGLDEDELEARDLS